jgi:transposase-like protein
MTTMAEKRRARYIANNALAHGLITKCPCETCGNPDAQKHHDDYEQPLAVRWLCRTCHAAQHPRSARPVPDWFKESARLHFEDGLPYRALAAQVGVPAGTVYHWLRKLRA